MSNEISSDDFTIFREAVSLKRLQQLRIREPSLVMRDDKHKMVEVGGLDDPDFDAEVIGEEEPSTNQFDYNLDSGFFRGGQQQQEQPEVVTTTVPTTTTAATTTTTTTTTTETTTTKAGLFLYLMKYFS